jgi:phage major head subunit gpT-like protein
MIINATNLNKIRTGFTSLFNTAFLAVKPQWSQIAMLVNSTGKEQKYGWLGQSTKFREWLGDRVVQNLKEWDFSIKNKKFENTIAVAADDIKDDNLGVYSPMFQMLGHDAATHPDQLVFDLLVAGFAGLCYDGQYFFDTDHPVIDKDGVTQSVSNTGGGSGSPWFLLDCRSPIKPFIFQKREDYKFVAMDDETDENVFKRDELVYGVSARVNAGYGLWQQAYGSKQTLDATAFKAGRTAMQKVTADGGKPLGVVPNLLVVGPTNEGAALEIVKAERLANGATNVYRDSVQIVVVPWLG